MKILVASDLSIEHVIGGGERVLKEQSTLLVQRGHSVSVLTRRLNSHSKNYQVIDGVSEYRYAVDRNSVWRFFQSTKHNALKLFEDIQGKEKFGVINFHQPFTAFAIQQSRLSRKIRRVYTCHSLAHEEYLSRNRPAAGSSGLLMYWLNAQGRRYLEGKCLKSSDAIVVLSNFTKGKLVKGHRLAPSKITVIPGGVDLDRFSPAPNKTAIRQRMGIAENRLVVLCIRNLIPRMGLQHLIAAFGKLRRQFPSALLVLGGTGPLRSELERLSGELGLNNHIRFAGFIPEAELADHYRMADIFVLPTVELEGFGMVTLEAMACGTPVLGTPVGGTVEILGPIDRGLLFRDSSGDAMAEMLTTTCSKIISDNDFLPELASRCRKFVENKYSWDKNIERIETVLEG